MVKKGNKNADGVNKRVSEYHVSNQRGGMNRVETTVAAEDVNLINDVAKVLRVGGPLAGSLREGIRALLPGDQAQTGEQLIDFFQTSPLREEDRHIFEGLRERPTGRSIDFE